MIGGDPGQRIQAAAEKHMDAVWDAYYQAEESDFRHEVDSPAVGPFCGCETCVIREVLAGAWPEIEKHFKEQR